MSRIAAIAADLADYDAGDLDVDTVTAFLARLVAPLAVTDTEDLALRDALGRVLADDIISPVSVPPHAHA